MLGYHFIDPYLGVEKGDNKIRGYWFWNSGLWHVLHISTWDSWKSHDKREQLLNVLSTCDLHFYALIIGFFRSA